MDMDPIRKRQSEVSRVGSNWETYVKEFLKKGLKLKKEEDLQVISQRELDRDYKDSTLYEAITIEVFHAGKFLRVPGDTDLIVFSKTIASCKLSLHGRLTESLFYAMYYRTFRKIKYVLATVDKGRQTGSGRWESEWGTPENPSKDRLLQGNFLMECM